MERDLEARLEQLTARLGHVERRLARLEGSGATVARDSPVAAETTERPAGPAVTRGVAELFPFVGRTLLILGGAFVLRAITERDLVGVGAGAALGIAYALVWLVLADRAAAATKRASATFYGLSTAIIALPLIGEATVKFEVLRPVSAAALLALVSGSALVVAWRHALRPLAWIITLGSVATAVALAVATKDLVAFAAFLLLLGLATLWIGDGRGWPGLGSAVAAVVDALLLLMAMVAVIASEDKVKELVGTEALITLLFALVVFYFGTFVYRTLVKRRDLTPLEMVQGIAAISIGLGGAIAVSRRTGEWVAVIGVAGLALAAVCYGAAFAFIDKRSGHRRNFIFYSTVGLLLTLLGFSVLLPGRSLAVALVIAALLTAWIGTWKMRATLSLHGAAYVLGAAISSGTIVGASLALFAPSVPDGAWITPTVWAVILAAAVLCWLSVASHGRTWGHYSRLPKLAVLAVLALGIGGVVVTLAVSLLPAQADPGVDPAWVAVIRTAALALSAVLLSLVARWDRVPESGWLVYPVLVVGGLKLVIEDFPNGRPVSLVLSLALYGGALVLAPRLLRRSRRGERTAPS